MACLFLSSIPFLDLIDSFILLAAEVVAIIYLNEEAHSAFWFVRETRAGAQTEGRGARAGWTEYLVRVI